MAGIMAEIAKFRERKPAPLRNDLKIPLCHSELVSESPKDSNNPDEILKQVQDDTSFFVL